MTAHAPGVAGLVDLDVPNERLRSVLKFRVEQRRKGGIRELDTRPFHAQHPGQPVEHNGSHLNRNSAMILLPTWSVTEEHTSYQWTHFVSFWSSVVKIEHIDGEHSGRCDHYHATREEDSCK